MNLRHHWRDQRRRLCVSVARLQDLWRTRDLAFIAAAFIPLVPLFLLIVLSVRLTSPGPVFYRSAQFDPSGRRFDVFKLRTRTITAEGITITSVGRFLEEASLDELPQLINVLRGEMSLFDRR